MWGLSLRGGWGGVSHPESWRSWEVRSNVGEAPTKGKCATRRVWYGVRFAGGIVKFTVCRK